MRRAQKLFGLDGVWNFSRLGPWDSVNTVSPSTLSLWISIRPLTLLKEIHHGYDHDYPSSLSSDSHLLINSNNNSMLS